MSRDASADAVTVNYFHSWRNGERRTHIEGLIVDGRPWVALDPEDREQVERLADAFGAASDPSIGWIDQMRAALREFANPTPPKPDEPTGDFARVLNFEGATYYRSPSGVWRRERDDFSRSWELIGAVRVLSEGVAR